MDINPRVGSEAFKIPALQAMFWLIDHGSEREEEHPPTRKGRADCYRSPVRGRWKVSVARRALSYAADKNTEIRNGFTGEAERSPTYPFCMLATSS